MLHLGLWCVQERKAAEKVRREARVNGNAHEMARYDKGSIFLNLLISKKSDRVHGSQQVGPLLHQALHFPNASWHVDLAISAH